MHSEPPEPCRAGQRAARALRALAARYGSVRDVQLQRGRRCVEVATTGQAVLVRDSKDVSRPHLALGLTGWTDFVRYAAGS